MIIGLLNKRITIEKGTTEKNSVGTPILIWSEYITPYAGIYTPSSDTRFTQNGQIFFFRTEFTLRYNNKTKVLNNKYRVKYNGTYYKILQVQEIGIKEGMKLITILFDDNGE